MVGGERIPKVGRASAWKRWRGYALLAAVVTLAAGHLGYGYWPRERTASPRRGDLPARLLAAGRSDVALWIPYPHQNLAVLRRAAGGMVGYPEEVGALARLPARELILTADLVENGAMRPAAAAARVYPLPALLARAAGLLAGNPWLAGGEVRWGARAARVAWKGTLWTLTPAGEEPAAPPPGDPPAPEIGEPLLAALRLRETAVLPAGLYRLTRRGGEISFHLGAPGASAPAAALEELLRPPLALVALYREAGGEPLVLLLFEGAGGGEPGAAVAGRAGRGWTAAGAGLAMLLGSEGHSATRGPWRVEASGRRALDQATALLPRLGRLSPPAGGALLLAAAPGPTRQILAHLRSRRAAGAGPAELFFDRRREPRWRALEAAFALATGEGTLRLVARRRPGAFELLIRGAGEGR